MLSENRTYHAIGKLSISKSRILSEGQRPKDDKQNWLFLCVKDRRFSFVYKIEQPELASYCAPFGIIMAFTVDDGIVRNFVNQNFAYDVLRGEEVIGSVEIVEFLGSVSPPG
jgi:hypothetical protein